MCISLSWLSNLRDFAIEERGQSYPFLKCSNNAAINCIVEIVAFNCSNFQNARFLRQNTSVLCAFTVTGAMR